MTLNDIFPNIFVINISNNTERRDHIINELQNINFQFLEAIVPNIRHPKKRQKLGNRLSHLKAIQIAKSNSWPNILVFEDDIVLDHGFMKPPLLKQIHDFISREAWACLYLGGRHRTFPQQTGYSNIRDAKRVIGTHAIAYNSQYYDQFINLYDQKKKRKIPIDYFLSGNQKSTNNFLISHPCYSSYPVFIYQKSGYNIKKKYIPINFWFEKFYTEDNSF
jgi:GR25 family glycosyltransferase involved in LPS biosynthesis